MYERVRDFLRDESGAAAIEYGLIAGLIAIGLLGMLTLTGESLQSVFQTIATTLDGITAGDGGSGS